MSVHQNQGPLQDVQGCLGIDSIKSVPFESTKIQTIAFI